MGDLGRESQQLQHLLGAARAACNIHCATAKPGPGELHHCIGSPQLLLAVGAWQGTGALGTQEWKTHLPFAESFNIIRCTALPSSQSDAGTDLFSHQ